MVSMMSGLPGCLSELSLVKYQGGQFIANILKDIVYTYLQYASEL